MKCINEENIPIFSEDLRKLLVEAYTISNEKEFSRDINLGNDDYIRVYPSGRFALIKKGVNDENLK